MSVVLFPNFGGEEGDPPPTDGGRPSSRAAPTAQALVLRHLAQAWTEIFSPTSAFGDVDDAGALLVAWLNTRRAADQAQRLRCSLFGSPPDIVDIVHDKAFCADVVARHQLLPAEVLETLKVIDPADLDVDALAKAILPPRWLKNSRFGYAFKPRFGSSGRGRVDSRRPQSEWAQALPRLRARGGVVVEPWFNRVVDLSAIWRIHDDGRIALLGTTTALVSPSGVWGAAEMIIDDDGIPRSVGRSPAPGQQGHAISVWERQLVDESFFVVEAAASAGYRGPCGVDAFVFKGPTGMPLLRLVELNARFTAGLVAVALALASKQRQPGSVLIFQPSTSPILFSRSAPASE